ncbi:MAG: hypothetical protein LZF62_230004 [Nitrospira sp.]|nr:MAG: hypothetical protein LZF62_230004 [Nitrospira sp.]
MRVTSGNDEQPVTKTVPARTANVYLIPSLLTKIEQIRFWSRYQKLASSSGLLENQFHYTSRAELTANVEHQYFNVGELATKLWSFDGDQ